MHDFNITINDNLSDILIFSKVRQMDFSPSSVKFPA